MNEQGKAVLLRIEDGVAQVTLNRPGIYNAVDISLANELMRVMHQCADDSRVRVVVLNGAGSSFCAGGDLAGISGAGDDAPAYVREILLYHHETIATIDRLQAPVLAAVQGSVAGAGFGLACSCDIVIAARSSRFLAAYTKVGLSPDGSTTWFLPRIIGLQRAMDLVLTNRQIDAVTAEAWGIVSRVVADDELMTVTLDLARSLANGPTAAFGAAKRLLRDSLAETLHTQMDRECDSLAQKVVSADGREGMAAFLDRRPPRFGGQAANDTDETP